MASLPGQSDAIPTTRGRSARRGRRRRALLDGGVPFNASSTSSGKTFSPPVLMQFEPRPSSTMRAVGLDGRHVAGERVADAVHLAERPRRLLRSL